MGEIAKHPFASLQLDCSTVVTKSGVLGLSISVEFNSLPCTQRVARQLEQYVGVIERHEHSYPRREPAQDISPESIYAQSTNPPNAQGQLLEPVTEQHR